MIAVPAISPQEAVEGGYVVVDVRSPREFAEGHMPGAVNLPFLDDVQRARVGERYRHGGAPMARVVAVDLVSQGLPTYLRSLQVLASRGRLAVMCWRGGERSRNVVLLLSLIGVRALRVEGGYRAYRRWVLDCLDAWQPTVPVVTLYGYTGSGKTELLRALKVLARELTPRPAVVDLEGLALHRGSLLGGLNQPGRRTQKEFDALLWEALRTAVGDYLVVEGEGSKIGNVFLHERVAETLRCGLPVLVGDSLAARTRRLLREYAPETWSPEDAERFRRSLTRIGERLPRSEVARLARTFDEGRFAEVVEGLLVGYYDPLYERSSVAGRDFVLRYDPPRDDSVSSAREFAAALARVLGDACSATSGAV